jgi:hypothetical protein
MLTAGCEMMQMAGLPPAGPAAVAGSENNAAVTDLVVYGNTVRRLDGRQLEQQYERLVLENDVEPTSEASIRLALLLSAPNAPFADMDQATRFLRDVMYRESSAEPANAALAQLLYNIFSERIYAESDDEPLQALLDQSRERNDELSSELQRMRAALDQERKRSATLEGQLSALKELEVQLSQEEIVR